MITLCVNDPAVSAVISAPLSLLRTQMAEVDESRAHRPQASYSLFPFLHCPALEKNGLNAAFTHTLLHYAGQITTALVAVNRGEEVRVVEVALVDTAVANGLKGAVVDAPLLAVELPAGLDTGTEGVEDIDGGGPGDAGVAVGGEKDKLVLT